MPRTKPYTCPLCGKKTKTRVGLTRHENLVHGESQTLSPKQKQKKIVWQAKMRHLADELESKSKAAVALDIEAQPPIFPQPKELIIMIRPMIDASTILDEAVDLYAVLRDLAAEALSKLREIAS